MKRNRILENIILEESMPRKLAQEAWDSRLYVRQKTWQLQYCLKRIIKQGLGSTENMLLAKLSDMPVGVCVISDGHIEVYVKQAYRGYGIGRLLVETIRDKHIGFIWGSEGKIGTTGFWKKLGIEVK